MNNAMSAAANSNAARSGISYGDKYEEGLDIAEIAKRVRGDLKAAVKSGELPKAKYGVRISRYSMGRSLSVKVDEVPFAILNVERVRRDVLEPHVYHADMLPLHSDEARALLEKVEAIVGAYNYDGSRLEEDYFHVNFHTHVEFAWDGQEKRERAELTARFQGEKAAAAAAPALDMTDEEDARLEAKEAAIREEMARDARYDACPASWAHEPGHGCCLCEVAS